MGILSSTVNGSSLMNTDPAVFDAISAEVSRQESDLELIASENYVSKAVLEALGSPLTNKYAEGLPNRRYYGGCEHVDIVENIARKRARELFMPEGFDIGVNVQPHAGAQANSAVFLALLNAGDGILGLDLSNGGHLTHGSPVNSSGKLYQASHYLLGDDGKLDMGMVRDAALKHRPKLIICGASAYPRTIDFEAFRTIADEIGAWLMADIAHVAGLVVTGHHPNPFPHCHVVTTTTHKTLRGPRGGMILAQRDLMKRMNSAVFPGTQGGPLMHSIAAKAVAFGEAQLPSFTEYSSRVVSNAQAMASRLIERDIKLVSGGTDNHLMLLDFSSEEFSGKDAEAALGRAGITTNKNTVPNEKRSPMVTSGVRVGTPAMTTRGANGDDSVMVADWIADVLQSINSDDVAKRVRGEVEAFCGQHPVYGGRV
jgi:glycine hydroxymethyltransferase